MKKFLTFVLVLAMVMSVSSVAMASPTEVDTFEELKNAVALGGEIKLTGDITTSETLVITKDVIIDGSNGTPVNFKLDYTGSDRAIDIPTSSEKVNVTIKDLKVIGDAQRGINYNDDGELTLENVQVGDWGTLFTYALNLPGSSDGCKVTINGGYYTGCIAINVWGANSTINVTGAELTSVDNSAEEGYGVVTLNSEADGAQVTISGSTINIAGSNPNGSKEAKNVGTTGTITINGNNDAEMLVAIVQHGDCAYAYKSLEDAIASSHTTDGKTIELLTDDVDVSSIQTDKNLTIKTKDGKEYVTKNGKVGVDAGNGIFVTPPELKFDTVKAGYAQPEAKMISVQGVDTSDKYVTVTVSAGYEVSSAKDSGYADSVKLDVDSSAPSDFKVYVRPQANLGAGTYNGSATVQVNNSSDNPKLDKDNEVALTFVVEPNSSQTVEKPSSGSGISVTYNGGNSFSTSNPSVPTGVEIDGVPVTFNGTGSNFSVGCISSDAKWVTVRWNSTSVTTNFTPDGLVECTTVSIPKTGDMSFWAAIAQFLGF